MRVEELECRTQPALFGVSASFNALASLDHGPSTQALLHANEHASFLNDSSLSAQANSSESFSFNFTLSVQAHGQTLVVIFLSAPVGNSPTEPSGGGSGVSDRPSITSPTVSGPTASIALPAATESSASFALLGREITSQAHTATTTVATATPLTSASLLLPPGATADTSAATAATAAALAPDAPAATQIAPASVTFPGTASIPYITTTESLTSNTLFGAADGPLAAAVPVNARVGPVEVTTAQRIDLAPDGAEDVVAFAPPQQPAANADVFNAVAVEVAADAPAPAAPAEEGTSPWAWAAAALGSVAGASWAVRRYWLKPAPANTPADARSWRRYLLGFDFYRM